MKNVKTGIFFGSVFALIDALLMIPIPIPDKTIAILSASINRFAIGYFIATTSFPKRSWLRGTLIGVLLSTPDAIITKTYLPIVGIGAMGGLGIGLILDKLVKKKI